MRKKLIEGILGVTSYTTPAIVYLALFTDNPTDTGDITNEVSASDYERISLDGKFGVLTGTGGALSNIASISFSEATSAWGVVTHIGIMLSGTKTTDDMILYETSNPARDVIVGKTLEFPVGFLSVTVS